LFSEIKTQKWGNYDWVEGVVIDLKELKEDKSCVDDLRHLIVFEDHVQEFKEETPHAPSEFINRAEFLPQKIHRLSIITHFLLIEDGLLLVNYLVTKNAMFAISSKNNIEELI